MDRSIAEWVNEIEIEIGIEIKIETPGERGEREKTEIEIGKGTDK